MGKRILYIEPQGILPDTTHQGNSIIQYSLLEGLAKAGASIGLLLNLSQAKAFDEQKRVAVTTLMEGIGCQTYFVSEKNQSQRLRCISDAIKDFRPDWLLVSRAAGLKLVAHFQGKIKIAVVFVDLEHLPKLYHAQIDAAYGAAALRAKALVKLPWLSLRALQIKADTLRSYAKADALINHAHHHSVWIQSQTGLPTLYAPNPVNMIAGIEERLQGNRTLADPPKFLLLGGLKGVATISGLYFFARQVLPHLRQALRQHQIQIHLIGRKVGAMPPSLKRIMEEGGIQFRGYVEHLTEECLNSCAMLVPTTIELGFRTRILDGFRYGLPSIVHPSNALGFPELKDRINCLFASDGQTFARTIIGLAENPDIRNQIAMNAFQEFQQNLNNLMVGRQVLQFLSTDV